MLHGLFFVVILGHQVRQHDVQFASRSVTELFAK
jgi:hypothetical protein